MKKNFNMNKRVTIFIAGCTILIAIFAASFAYMSGVFDKNNVNHISQIDTANLSLVFDDDDEGINDRISPNESVTKRFTIRNTGDDTVIAKIMWKNLINTYTEGSLTYSVSFTEDKTGNYTEIISNIDVPRCTTKTTRSLASHLVIPVGKTYYYNLTITFNDLPDVNQDADINAILSTVFSLEESSLDEIAEESIYIGKEYCLNDECFYIINQDETGYTLLSKYNLYVGQKNENGNSSTISETDEKYGKQNELARGDKTENVYGTISFGSSNDYETSNIKPYVDSYVKYLNDTYDLKATGRLVNTGDLEKLGCVLGGGANGKQGCGYPDYTKYEWLLNTTFWTESKGSTDNSIYIVGGDGFLAEVTSLDNSTNRGVRPVIKVGTLKNTSQIPLDYQDNGIFSSYYKKAYEKLDTLTDEEKIGQLLIASYSNQSTAINAIQNYHVGGVLFFEAAFTGKTLSGVQDMVSELKSKAKIPLMLPVDEEGGRVVRISPNLNLVSEEVALYPNLFYTNTNNKNAWKLAGTLYSESNNFESIIQQEQVRNNVFKKLGLNFNFAPVVDIANPPAYISDRAFGQTPELTGEYAKNVIQAGKGSGVGHSLKHFPGYGNNSDTHGSTSIDETSLEELWNTHLVPFVAGIKAGAEAVMISHNITAAIDKELPSSLSKKVHDLLFNEMGFTGLAITDDLSMDAIGDNYSKQYLKAFQAGNHILLTSTNFATAHTELLTALNDGTITSDELDKRVFKVLAWKYYNGLLD